MAVAVAAAVAYGRARDPITLTESNNRNKFIWHFVCVCGFGFVFIFPLVLVRQFCHSQMLATTCMIYLAMLLKPHWHLFCFSNCQQMKYLRKIARVPQLPQNLQIRMNIQKFDTAQRALCSLTPSGTIVRNFQRPCDGNNENGNVHSIPITEKTKTNMKKFHFYGVAPQFSSNECNK